MKAPTSALLVMLALGAAAAEEPPAELDAVEVTAARQRAIAYHTLMAGLGRRRSNAVEDKDLLVCVRRAPIGTHIARIECTTNEGWEYRRRESMRAVLGEVMSQTGRYIPRYQPMTVMSTETLQDLGEGQPAPADGDHALRLQVLAAEGAADRQGDEFGTPAAEVVRFARAFDAVRAIPGAGPAMDARRTQAVGGLGLTVEAYNALAARLEQSERFRARVYAALGVIGRP